MPVVSTMRYTGDSDELAAKIEEHILPISMQLAPKHGGLANIVARTDDGVLIINPARGRQLETLFRAVRRQYRQQYNLPADARGSHRDHHDLPCQP